MKGYADVRVSLVKDACGNYAKWHTETKALIDDLIIKYYEQEYNKLGWWGKWRNKHHSPNDFLWSRLGWADYYPKELSKVEPNPEILNEVSMFWLYSGKVGIEVALSNLVKASNGDTVKLDQDLCDFVNQWKTK